MQTAGLLVTALLFGGMVLYSFGFATFILAAFPADLARTAIRRAFPHFYVFVLITATVAAVLLWSSDRTSATLLAIIAITTIPTRQFLMPAINRATDSGAKRLFDRLHKVSVFITISHMVMSGVVLARFL
jgi:ABC-type transport system involved in multi-copper enzyme maturation permease subunit